MKKATFVISLFQFIQWSTLPNPINSMSSWHIIVPIYIIWLDLANNIVVKGKKTVVIWWRTEKKGGRTSRFILG